MPRSSKDYVMGERGVIIIIRGLEEEPAKTPKHMDNKNNNKNTTFLRPRKDRSRKRGWLVLRPAERHTQKPESSPHNNNGGEISWVFPPAAKTSCL